MNFYDPGFPDYQTLNSGHCLSLMTHLRQMRLRLQMKLRRLMLRHQATIHRKQPLKIQAQNQFRLTKVMEVITIRTHTTMRISQHIMVTTIIQILTTLRHTTTSPMVTTTILITLTIHQRTTTITILIGTKV